ncbi:GAF domain-containing SpoIIE family protein phosphatase [Nocardioides bruguierae]|uniref:SpoIIE family protein phosphatase n=1 Tax=Nocardioides bruguierae TaxID=2945102 RepID=A0A9X2D937_9ACTN|nr:SpoIIE family protein phosphatase [Nocardioides bruguierae]MCM0620324.1 SpoIIE family protein phosphatase [Nocardioides bruguierae]
MTSTHAVPAEDADPDADEIGVDESFDRYARMVRRAIGVPVALVSLVEAHRQLFIGAQGLEDELMALRQTPLSHSFCQYVVADEAPLVTADARVEQRLRDNLAIPDLGVVAYAGYPIRDQQDRVIGSLCAIDDTAREWTPEELSALEDIAAACTTEIVQRQQKRHAARTAARARDLNERSALLLALAESLSATRTVVDVAAAVDGVAREHLGALVAGIWIAEDDTVRRTADLPTHVQHAPGLLSYVRHLGEQWHSARLNDVLPADLSNPLGLALAEGRIVWFPDRHRQNAVYGGLNLERQVGEARAFVPLTHRGRAFGGMAVIWPESRDLGHDVLDTLQALGRYAAQALGRALLLQEQSDALMVLQGALQPRLPETDEMLMAARYRPAAARDQIGGDWYDAVLMPSGDTALMIGDIVGHDLQAAATMGQVRATLRTLAWSQDEAPSALVGKLDQALTDLQVEAMATLVYLRIETWDRTGDRVLRWTNAGHPPPLVVCPEGTVRFLAEDAPDVMLGVAPDAERGDHRLSVPPGATLLLYTDGLVERRGESLVDGLDRLAEVAATHGRRPIGEFVDGVLTDLLGLEQADDVAVLAVRFV